MGFQLKKNPHHWIIVGTGSGWELCPKQSNATVMVLNDMLYKEQYGIDYDILMIMDVLSEKPRVLSGDQNLGDAIQRINASKKPLISPYKYEEIPLSEPFPLEEWKEKFGEPYFLNTISYMIAYAILRGAVVIDIYGINQASSSEFFYEKASVEALIGICIGLGIKVTVHGSNSELWTTKRRFGGSILYGYNMPYENIIRDKKMYGETSVKKLLAPPPPQSRNTRKIN